MANLLLFFQDLIDLYQALGGTNTPVPSSSASGNACSLMFLLLLKFLCLFHSVSAPANTATSSAFIAELFESVLQLEWCQKAKCGTLQILVATYGTHAVLSRNTNFVEELLSAMG